MEKFKVQKKHLTGEIAYFPKRVVQAMVDEQVRQGNPADPSVFSARLHAGKDEGGFTWMKSASGFPWSKIILDKKFHLIPKREKPRCPDNAPRTEATPNEIIQHMLDKGMAVWVCGSDKSYDEARADIGRYVHRVTRYDADNYYPVRGKCVCCKYAIPIDTATMTEITEMIK